MNYQRLHYMLNSGKNSNLKYYLRSYLREYTPKVFSQWQLKRLLKQVESHPNRAVILKRAAYYCKLTADSAYNRQEWGAKAVRLRDQEVTGQKAYYFDAMQYARYFPQDLRWILDAGDKPYVAPEPAIVKNRPIVEHNDNSVILNLDKNRHFLFVNDQKSWRDKKNVAIFRGDLGPRKQNRDLFMNRWAGHPMVDAASTNRSEEHPEWQKPKLTIGEHLDYKFIMSLEGNDVASNLKWVMSSNSIAVSPRLTQETWFMEGTLIPNYHYIEVREDFEDLEERLTYYINHPDEAEAIIQHAHEYVRQFLDAKRERLISLLVLKRYFDVTSGLH
jgi:hypothetical protein